MADWDIFPLSKDLILTDGKLTFPQMPAPAAGIFDNPSACVRVNLEWSSFIIGRLHVLSSPYAWLGNETEKFRASQEIEELLLILSRPCTDDCPECPDPEPCPPCDPPSLRQNGNCIEWLNPATNAWECQLTISVPAGGSGCGDCWDYEQDCGCFDDDDNCEDCEGW